MGIKGLPKLIASIGGETAIRSYKFSYFKGLRVSVDASLIIHQTVIAMRKSGHDMKNNKGELTSHLHGLFYKILIFLQNGMIPVFVFDGKAPNIKNKTIERRRSRKTQAEKKLEELSDSDGEEYIKNFKQTFTPTKEDIKQAQILLDLMGIPYIVAPGEADVVCAWLAARRDINKKRYVKGVCSDDSDMLALGAPYLYKDILRFMSKNKYVKVIDLHETLVKMNLTMNQFVDLCVLLGTDYCDNIKGIGPKKAYILIKKYGTLEKVLIFLKKSNDTDSDNGSDDDSDCSDTVCKTNEQCMIEAKKYFKNALKEIDESDNFKIVDGQLDLVKYQYLELMDFMCVKHGFDVTRIQTGIERLKEYYKKMNITKENTKKAHKIIQPKTENYIMQALTNDIEFLSSSDSDSSDNSKPIKKKNLPVKKLASKKKNIAKKNIKYINKKNIDSESTDSDSDSNSKNSNEDEIDE
jgi:flap endonuclease-1